MFKFHSVKSKVMVSTFILLGLFFLIIFLVSESVFLNGFLSVERNDMTGDVQRVQGLLGDQISNYSVKIHDWAVWDDAYKFVQDGNKEFIDSNLQNSSLTSINLNFMFFIASSGAMVYQKGVDLKTGEEIKIPVDLKEYLSKPNTVTVHTNVDSESHGIIKLKEGFLLFSSRGIVKSNGEGPVSGTIIFGRFLDEGLLSYISTLNHSKVLIQPYDSNSLSEEFNHAKQALSSVKYFVDVISANEIAGFTIINDLNGKPAFILENELPRPFYVTGNATINYYLVIFGILCILSLIASLLMTNKVIIKKISKLNSDVEKIKDPNNSTLRLDDKGNDEFASLASNINKMLDEIIKSQEDLEKFKIAIESSSEQVVITDIDGKIIYVNDATEKLTGYSKKEIINNTPRLWGGQMSKEFYVNMWDTIKNKKQPFEARILNKNKNGQTYPVNNKIYPVIDKKGVITYFISVDKDISSEKKIENTLAELEKKNEFLAQSQKALSNILEDQKDLEEALKKEKEGVEQKIIQRTIQLREQQSRLTAALNSLTRGFILTDKEGKILLTNQSVARILGQPVNEWTLNEIQVKLGEKVEFVATYKKCLEENKPFILKNIIFMNKVLEIPYAPIYEEIESKQKKIRGVLIHIDDVTEVKILERSKDEFFSIASHELRTPLTAIRGNTSLIEQYYSEQLKDKDLKEMIDDIHESSVRLIGIVNDFLNVSRLEQGKMEFKLENFDIVELIAKKILEVDAIAKEKGIVVNFDKDGLSLINIYADKDRLGEVILNLLGNAIKYTEKGGSTTISIIKSDVQVKVSVTDTGKGISEQQANLLFRKFQQAGENILTRDNTQSTGLGLYISRLIIEAMHGQIFLESSIPDKGSVFSFTVPVAKQV